MVGATTFVYYENNRADARREVPVISLVIGYDASRWAEAEYDEWPLERRVNSYLAMDLRASFDARDPEVAPGYDALLAAIRDL